MWRTLASSSHARFCRYARVRVTLGMAVVASLPDIQRLPLAVFLDSLFEQAVTNTKPTVLADPLGWGREMSEGSPGNTDAPEDTKSAPASATDTNDGPSRDRKGPKSVLRSNWLIGIATGLISGIVVAFYLSASGQATLTAIRHHLTRPSCSNPQWLLQVPNSEVFTSAYYEQMDQIKGYGSFHIATNTIDGDLGTSWLQVWPSPSTYLGAGSSDYIEWSFAQPYNVRLICIVDGWAADLQTYRDTLPIGTATVYVTNEAVPPPGGSPSPSNTCTSQHASFRDYLHKDGSVTSVYQWQPVPFHCKTSDVVLHIESVSQTSTTLRTQYLVKSSLNGHQAPLAGLSEIKFYYCPTILCWLPTN